MSEPTLQGIQPRSRVMQSVFEKIRIAAAAAAPVLITGEGGTPRDDVAMALHFASSRAAATFATIDTPAFASGEAAAHLFGVERAGERRPGALDELEGGTLYIDEIAALDRDLQAALARFLESGTYARVGGKKARVADVRVVAATARDLPRLVEERAFHEDLYYRLSVVRIDVPPLRERREDILPLAHELMRVTSERWWKRVDILPADALRLLEAWSWPGNDADLAAVIESAVQLARGRKLDASLLPNALHEAAAARELIRIPLGMPLADAEREIITRTIEASDGNKARAATLLGISRRSLYDRLDPQKK